MQIDGFLKPTPDTNLLIEISVFANSFGCDPNYKQVFYELMADNIAEA